MEETRKDGNGPLRTESPFRVYWRIANFSHWSRDLHGDSFSTSVDFDHRQINFKVYPKSSAGGYMEIHFPEELSPYERQLRVKGPKMHDICSCRKAGGQPGVFYGPRFEEFKEVLRTTRDIFVLIFSAEIPCEYRRDTQYPTTRLQRVSPTTKSHGDDDPRRNPVIIPIHFKLCSVRKERHFDRQLISSLESLSIGEEQNQPLEKEEEKPSTKKLGDSMWARCRRIRLRKQAPVQLLTASPTGLPTLDKLVPSLESLSISRELPSANNRPAEETPLSPVDFPCKNANLMLENGAQGSFSGFLDPLARSLHQVTQVISELSSVDVFSESESRKLLRSAIEESRRQMERKYSRYCPY